MEQGYPLQGSGSGSVWTSVHVRVGQAESERTTTVGRNGYGSPCIVGLRVSNGLHLCQGGLNYGQLKRLVDKLEGLC